MLKISKEVIENLAKAKDRRSFWEELLQYLYREQELDAEGYRILLLFVPEEQEMGELWEEEEQIRRRAEQAERIMRRLQEVDNLYDKKDTMECSPHFMQYRMIWDQYAVNADKYIRYYFQRVKLYLLFQEMYQGDYDRLRLEADDKTCYKNYQNSSSMARGANCPSVIEDLVLGNVSRGRIMKRLPKHIEGAFEFDYDADGWLILIKKYIDYEWLYSREFLLYKDPYILGVKYDSSKKITIISLEKYQDGRIVLYETAMFITDCREIETQTYFYKDGILERAWREFYSFPSSSKRNDILDREEYLFAHDEENRLTGQSSKDYLGDWERKSSSEKQFYELSEKERLDTGKENRRWRMKNYFD